MWLHSLFASWKSGLSRSRRPQPRPARPHRFRPRLEVLEDRCVPSTLNVTSNLDNGASGTLRSAVAVADASTTPDTINILTTQPIVLTQGQLLLSASMTVEATAGKATISGGGLSRVFEVTGASVTLNALNITGGKAAAGINQPDATLGGGLLSLGRTLTVTNCTLSGNSATYNGGAIASGGGTLTVTNCTLSGNSAADYGGAIDGGGTIKVTNSTLSGNSASWGGAIAIGGLRFTLTVEQCTFSGNSATSVGGAIWALIEYPDSSAWIESSTFSGNTPNSLWSGGSAFWGEGDTGLPPGAVVLPTFHYSGG
jgi:predicted outer membrane repeat protein